MRYTQEGKKPPGVADNFMEVRMRKVVWIVIPLIVACATTGMQKKEEEAPLRTKIEASKEKIYQITATKLMEYGFEIESSDPVLGRITTNYVDLEPGILKGALLGSLGAEDFNASITTQIIESDSGFCELIMRGVVKYAVDRGLFREDEIKHQPVRKDSYTYNQMQEISLAVKEESEQ